MMQNNLNLLEIPTDHEAGMPLTDHSVCQENANFEAAEAYFKNVEDHLVEKIYKHGEGFIFGSVAWLTSERIIKALAYCDNVQILIQKEDFLRPDFGDTMQEGFRRSKYRALYSTLRFDHDKFDCREPICNLSVLGDCTVDPVRCVGNYNRDTTQPNARAHNKFLVFCEQIKDSTDETRTFKEDIYKPVAVWTGSYNFTNNSGNSFENAIYLEDSSGKNPIIEAYLNEHHQIFALSEKLDWESNWVQPEYRIGT